MDRQEAMEQEFSKSSGGNYFNYVDVNKLERMGITQWKPSLGENAIRIVFPPKREGFYGLAIRKHSNIGANKKTFLCRKEMFNDVCPVCVYADALKKEDPKSEAAKTLYAAKRYLFFVVDVKSQESESKGIRWFDCPTTIYKEIKIRSKIKRKRGAAEGEEFKKYIDVSHPTEGRDINFEQVKVDGKFSYAGVTLLESEPVPEEWYKDLPEFKDILKISAVEEMEEAIYADEDDDADSTEDTNTNETTEIETAEEEVKSEKPPVRTRSRETAVEEETEVEEAAAEVKEEKSTVLPTRGGRDATKSSTEEMSMKDRVRARVEAAKQARQNT